MSSNVRVWGGQIAEKYMENLVWKPEERETLGDTRLWEKIVFTLILKLQDIRTWSCSKWVSVWFSKRTFVKTAMNFPLCKNGLIVYLSLGVLNQRAQDPSWGFTLLLYIHETVHRNKFIFNNQPDALIIQIYSVIKLYMFRVSSLPIIRSFLLYIRPW